MMMSIVKMIKLLKSAKQISTNYAWQVSKPDTPIKGRNRLSCHHERQIREDKSAERKGKP